MTFQPGLPFATIKTRLHASLRRVDVVHHEYAHDQATRAQSLPQFPKFCLTPNAKLRDQFGRPLQLGSGQVIDELYWS
ncbi:MAG: hypothetical protein U0936_18815 [Planctomycetaceae bacterium]